MGARTVANQFALASVVNPVAFFVLIATAFRRTCCKFTKFSETACSDTSWDSLMRKDPSSRIGSNYRICWREFYRLDCPQVLKFINCDVTLNFDFLCPTPLKNFKNCYTTKMNITTMIPIIKNFEKARFIYHCTCH